jgi:hypothetical protein
MKKIPIETQSEWLNLLLKGYKGGSDNSILDLKHHTSGLYIMVEEVKLSDFLKENNCYDEFLENTDREYVPNNFKSYVDSAICSAFYWRNSKQGFDYWCNIDIKWKAIKHKTNDMLWLLDKPTKFNYEKIMKPKTVVHCITEAQANELLKWADSKGLKWCDGSSYMEYNNWREYNQETCYYLYKGEFCDKKYYKAKGYTVLSFEEAKDLKPTVETVTTKFNYEKIMRPNTVIKCITEAQANELLKWADSKGLKWFPNISYMEYNNWREYNQETCYYLYKGEFCYEKYYDNKGYTILSFEEAKELTKETKSITIKKWLVRHKNKGYYKVIECDEKYNIRSAFEKIKLLDNYEVKI